MRPSHTAADHVDNLRLGVYPAIVTPVHDAESEVGRIKVRLPWDQTGETEAIDWAQVVTPMGGAKMGFYAIPEKESQVLVMFINGDIHFPVVLGGLWGQKTPDPEKNDDNKNNFRGYRSRSGHRLVFDDSEKVKVVLTDKSNQLSVVVGSFESAGEGANRIAISKPSKAEKKSGVAFTSLNGNLNISCKQLSVEAGEDVRITASKSAMVTGNTFSAEGKTISAIGTMAVAKGAMVMCGK